MFSFLKYYILLLVINSCYATTIIMQMRNKYNVSAISLSIALPVQKSINNYTSGQLSIQNKTKITPDNLYQVGSITKNFTAAIILIKL